MGVDRAACAPLGAILALAVACSGRAAAPPSPAPEPPALRPAAARPQTNAICPDVVRHYDWNRELFPGCPPRPFWWIGTTCEDDCPRPCRSVETDPAVGKAMASRFEYDEAGRWTRTIRGGEVGGSFGGKFYPARLPGERYCSRTGSHDGVCEVAVINPRPGRERITQATLRYDDWSNVISIQEEHSQEPDAVFEYAADKLVLERTPGHGGTEITTEYRYDHRGRVVEIVRSEVDTTTYTYDDIRGLLIRIVSDSSAKIRFTYGFEYDDQRRPVRLTLDTEQGKHTRHDEKTYFYDCAEPRPFSEATAAMEGFVTRACACSDAACRAEVSGQLDDWRRGITEPVDYERPHDDEATRFAKLVEDARACLKATD